MKKRILIAVAAGCLTLSPVARAEQGGSGHYTPGQTASFIDQLPGKPGWAYLNEFLYYDGNFGGGRTLPLGGVVAANVDGTIYADTSVLLYETPWGILGGNFAFAAAIPQVWMTVHVNATFTGPGGPPVSGARSQSVSGIGDIEMFPLMLGWTNGTDIKYDVRLGIYAPSGAYSTSDLANIGKNYWTFEPSASFSWLSSKIGTEFTTFVGADFNTENDDGDYHTGSQAHIDATLAQHLPLGKGFAGLGITGYYYKQFTGDSGAGASLGSFEGKTVGLGPVISYAMKVGKTDVITELKWLHEVEVKNRLEGDYVWFKLGILF